MKRLLLIGIVIALYLLHQDFWFWRESRPLFLGFLPIGLFYHVIYTLAVTLVMWLLVKLAWPAHLEAEEIKSGKVVGNGSQPSQDF